jgi:hypothetical protein
MLFAYDDNAAGNTLEVSLAFGEVSSATLPTFAPRAYVSELEIEYLGQDQLEGIMYRIKDYGESRLEIYCKSIAIFVQTNGAEAEGSAISS